LNNPSANTFTGEGLDELRTVIGKLNADARVRAVVITAAAKSSSAPVRISNSLPTATRRAARSRSSSGPFRALQQARP